MIVFFLILGLVCVLGAAAGWTLLRRWGRGAGLAGALLGLAVGGLFFPFPIHGGVMFLGEVLWEEVGHWAERAEERQEVRRDAGFRELLEQRFAGDLPFVPGRRLDATWTEARLEDGSVAWYDSASGLVWSDPQAVPAWQAGGDVEPGRRFCAQRAPAGYWALPLEGDLLTFWEHAGQRVSPWRGQSTPSVLDDESARLLLPVWFIGAERSVAVRCVARGPRAPKAGYPRADIDTGRWNRYQLEKVRSLRGRG